MAHRAARRETAGRYGSGLRSSLEGLLQRRRALVQGAALLALTLAVYGPALDGGLLWDDDEYIGSNPLLEDTAGLRDIWLRPGATTQYYPLTFSSLWLQHQLWGLDTLGYHLVSAALHALAAFLLWRLLRELEVGGAWSTAVVFAVHPVLVASVAWLAELKNVQSGALYLACLLAYFRARPPVPPGHGAASSKRRVGVLPPLLFAAALLSKSVGVLLPAVILLVVWWKRGRIRAADLRSVAPMVMMAAVMALVTIHAERRYSGTAATPSGLSPVARVLVAGRALWFYAGTLVWPAGLTSVYPRWEVDPGDWWQYGYPLAAAAALAGLWLLRSRLGRGPVVAAGAFVLFAAPALGLVDIAYFRYSFVADHFQYHAAPALLALLMAGVARLARRWPRLPAAAAVVAGGLLVTALAGASWRRAHAYQSEEARCLATLAANPSAWSAMNNLGVELAARRQTKAAVERYREALRLNLDYDDAHYNLGAALEQLGDLDGAAGEYAAAIRCRPTYAKAHCNLGDLRAKQGDLDEAIEHLEEALRLWPGFTRAHRSLAAVLALKGRFAESASHFREVLRREPDDAIARNGLQGVEALQRRGQPRSGR